MNDLDRIEQGLMMLLSKDEYLLRNSISERSITHKMGEYYQQLFPEWNVDCEYNKNLGGPKEIKSEITELLNDMANNLRSRGINTPDLTDFLALTDSQKSKLLQQLLSPEFEYDYELDLYVFILKDGSKKIRKTIFPDIIIHHRGTKDNKIVIEVKKSRNRSKLSKAFDILKLEILTRSSRYQYKRGFYIEIPTIEDLQSYSEFIKETNAMSQVTKILPKHIS